MVNNKILFTNNKLGYKYGVWLVYKKGVFPTTHIGHFTISCFMEKKDAFSLYDDIYRKSGKTQTVNISPKPVIFDRGMYKDDDNRLEAWGYNGRCNKWTQLKELSKKYKCNFSHCPHTTIQYSTLLEDLKPKHLDSEMFTHCTLEVADITSDDPRKWKLITK